MAEPDEHRVRTAYGARYDRLVQINIAHKVVRSPVLPPVTILAVPACIDIVVRAGLLPVR
jgi:hypothetical protein